MAGFAYILGGKVYDFLDEHFEKSRYKKVRKKMLSNIKGKVLDAGCGTGRNFPFYPKSTKVLAVDKSKRMLKIARERASNNIKTKNMDLTNLDLPDDHFDSVISTFVLCTMPKNLEKKALDELVRVTKKNSKLYFLEYVYSQNKLRRFFMKLTYFIPRFLYGIRFNSTLPMVKENPNLEIDKLEFVYDDVLLMIVARKINKNEKNL